MLTFYECSSEETSVTSPNKRRVTSSSALMLRKSIHICFLSVIELTSFAFFSSRKSILSLSVNSSFRLSSNILNVEWYSLQSKRLKSITLIDIALTKNGCQVFCAKKISTKKLNFQYKKKHQNQCNIQLYSNFLFEFTLSNSSLTAPYTQSCFRLIGGNYCIENTWQCIYKCDIL